MSTTGTVDEQRNAVQAKVDALVATNDKLVAERDEYRKLYLSLLETCRKLELGILGQKREKVTTAPGQLSLAVLATLLSEQARGTAPEPPAELELVREHTRQKPAGRKPLPEKLPRVEIEVLTMREDALTAPYLCTDATGVLVQAKDRCGHGHFWVVIAPERHVLFEYTAKHDAAAVDTFLAGYKGYLVADAHVVVDHLYRKGDIVEVGCWCRARRYFYKALETDPDRARHALALIAGIFVIERKLAQVPPERRSMPTRTRSTTSTPAP